MIAVWGIEKSNADSRCYKPTLSPIDCQIPAGPKQWWMLRAVRKTLQAAAAASLDDINRPCRGLAAVNTLGA